jgi:hypothetical protein
LVDILHHRGVVLHPVMHQAIAVFDAAKAESLRWWKPAPNAGWPEF